MPAIKLKLLAKDISKAQKARVINTAVSKNSDTKFETFVRSHSFDFPSFSLSLEKTKISVNSEIINAIRDAAENLAEIPKIVL